MVADWIGSGSLTQAETAVGDVEDAYSPLTPEAVAHGDCTAMQGLAQALVKEVSL